MDLTLRRATDADAVAEMYIRARRAAADVIPSTVHSDDEVRAWITAIVIPRLEAWIAERERPGGLRLKTFVSNEGAQRVYLRRGFTEAGRTEGDNEEGEPDILYVWPGGLES